MACGDNGGAEPQEVSELGGVPLVTLGNPIDDSQKPDDATPVNPGALLFVEGQILEVEIHLPSEQLQAIEEQGNEEVYLPAQAVITGTGLGSVSFGEVGFRHKGAWSLHHCWDDNGGVRSYEGTCAKLSYKLKFNKFDDDERLDGLKRLNLHSSSGDSTSLREFLAYDTYRHFGIDAPRTAVVRLTINGSFAGLFIGVEAIDGRYTKAHFPEGGGDGNLYKEVWPSPQLEQEDFVDSLRTNRDTPDASAFMAFAQTLGNGNGTSFDADMQQWVDIEETLRYIAVDRALKNWDGIMAFYSPSSPHNFYWYHDVDGSGLFRLVPWDMDNTLWEFDPYMSPEQWVSALAVPDWNVNPRNCEPRSVWELDGGTKITPPRCDPFLSRLAETHWQQFEAIGQELLDDTFNPQRMLNRVDYFANLIEPTIAEDPYIDLNQWRQERQRLEQTLRDSASDFDGYLNRGLTNESN